MVAGSREDEQDLRQGPTSGPPQRWTTCCRRCTPAPPPPLNRRSRTSSTGSPKECSVGPGARPCRAAIDTLEARLLLSADPINAAFALSGEASLRVSEVTCNAGSEDEPGERKELRVQLIQAINAEDSSATVIAERRILEIDGENRVITGDWDDASYSPIGNIDITGSVGVDHLAIDEAILSLASTLSFDIDLGTGTDRLTGPASPEGVIWTLNSLSGSTAGGELSTMAATDDLLEWTIDSIATAGTPESRLSIDDFELPDAPASAEIALDWVSLGASSTLWGADDVTGGDTADRLIFSYTGSLRFGIEDSEDSLSYSFDLSTDLSGG